MNTKRIIPTLVLVLAATGCGGASMPSSAPTATAAPAEESASVASVAGDAKQTAGAAQPTASTNAKTASADPKKTDAQSPDFLIMYTGDVVMSVDDGKVSDAIDHIIDVSESVGGHLAGRRDQGVSIRVPSSRFREALGKISALGEVVHESVTAEDVSEEYHDAEVRLANMKATRQRLQDFLSKSANMTDMLTLERELERVSMDIDRVEGRMRFLREHSAYSTLTVALVPRPKSQAVVAGGKVIPNSPRVMSLHANWLDDMGVPKLVESN